MKEIHIINSGFRKDGIIIDGNNYNAKLLIQCHEHPIELILTGVRKLNFNQTSDIYGGSIEIQSTTEELFVLKMDNEFEVSSTGVYYRIQDEFWGNKVFLNGHIPTPDITWNLDLGDNWRQCEDCGEAWSQDITIKIDACPFCNNMTEFKK